MHGRACNVLSCGKAMNLDDGRISPQSPADQSGCAGLLLADREEASLQRVRHRPQNIGHAMTRMAENKDGRTPGLLMRERSRTSLLQHDLPHPGDGFCLSRHGGLRRCHGPPDCAFRLVQRCIQTHLGPHGRIRFRPNRMDQLLQ